MGTHKVMAFVNDDPHPLAPFPIRVYDASEIIVGDIVRESIINDIVEFTGYPPFDYDLFQSMPGVPGLGTLRWPSKTVTG